MFLFQRPSKKEIDDFIASQQGSAFSYLEVGATQSGSPAGYNVDQNRIRLGSGEKVFQSACNAMQRWQMFNISWLQICWENSPIEVGSIVAVCAKHFGFYSINPCQIVYKIEEDGVVKRFGFAYGTLQEHAAKGEERFLIEWDREEGSVFYDILAFSLPAHPLVMLGYPVSRYLQSYFASQSKQAMLKAIG